MLCRLPVLGVSMHGVVLKAFGGVEYIRRRLLGRCPFVRASIAPMLLLDGAGTIHVCASGCWISQ